MPFYSLGYNWDAKVHDILADLGTEFYFYDPLRSNLTSLRDLGSHSTGIARNDFLWVVQNMSRTELMSRLRYTSKMYYLHKIRIVFLYIFIESWITGIYGIL